MATNRNPIAKALRSSHLKPRKVKPAKGKGSFKRKDKHNHAGVQTGD